MRRRLLARLALLPAALLLGACRDKYAVPKELTGGLVEMGVSNQDPPLFLEGEFWSEREGQEFDYSALPVPGCMLIPNDPVPKGLLEVGPEIRVEHGPSKLLLEVVRDDQGQPGYAPAESSGTVIPGLAYDVQIGENRWVSRLRVPHKTVPEQDLLLYPSDRTLTLEKGRPLVIRYQPAVADRLLLYLVSGSKGAVCHLGGEGSFRIPAAAIDAAPPEGYLELEATDQEVVDLKGRPIELRGVLRESRPYRRVAPRARR